METVTQTKSKLGIMYPIKDEDRYHYVRFPVQRPSGWYGVNVLLPTGFMTPEDMPELNPVSTEAECQKWCDVHNKYIGLTKKQVVAIIKESMDNAPKE